MDLKTVEGCSLSMDTPSPDSAADSMTGLMQGCEVGHRGVTISVGNASTQLTRGGWKAPLTTSPPPTNVCGWAQVVDPSDSHRFVDVI